MGCENILFWGIYQLHDKLVTNDYYKEFGIHQIQVSSLVYKEVVLIRIHISNWKLKTTDG